MLFKIVFKGEIGFDYDQDEVRENLRTHCGFDRNVIDRLFSGGAYVLKKDIDEETANRYQASLHRLGALCDIVPMSPPVSAAEPKRAESIPASPLPERGDFTCPACGHGQERGDVCGACGIYFGKFERAQARKARAEAGAPDATLTPEPGASRREGVVPEGAFAVSGTVSTTHSATRPFLQQCALAILAMVLFQCSLGSDLMIVGFVLLPFVFLLYLLFRVMASGQYLADIFEEYVAFEPGRCEKKEPEEWVPRVTCSIILLDLILYYGLVIPFGPEVLARNFAFLPESPNFWNVSLSAFLAPFLHAGGWQVWGSAVFLWVLGTVVEKRIGRIPFLVCYLLTALLAGGAGLLAHRLLLHAPLHGLGSSGAIAGMIGIFAVCGSNRYMQFSLPIIGLVSSVRLKVRINPLIVIGLFFFASLGGGIDRTGGLAAELVGHLANLGGMLAGMLIGLFLDPESLNSDDRQMGTARGVATARLPLER